MRTETVDLGRRRSLGRALMLGAGIAGAVPLRAQKDAKAMSDQDILNFALNLEFLEAEYYTRGVTGRGLGAGGNVQGGSQVPFRNDEVREILTEIAENERAHVAYLRGVLGNKAIQYPAVDFVAGFREAGRLAGLGDDFNPFADELSFMLGGYLFEDVGVTAYKGAAALIDDGDILEAAAGILGVEGYHMGSLRWILYRRGERAHLTANAVSDARDALDGPMDLDQGVTTPGAQGTRANLVPADEFGRAFSRTPQQVLNIVYLTPQQNMNRGGFFPNGVNGAISRT
ncbi:MAG: ferritin-like domain-containing protein [Acidobacteriota bacterium]|nr:ferritin-like domain-containing protein [Acidobacteriota bacterium]